MPPASPLGEMANPRKTRIARFSRRMSSSSKRPICAPTLDFGTVVILSTITRGGREQPVAVIRFDGQAKQGRFCLIGGKGADRDRVRGIETIILDDDDRTGFARVIPVSAAAKPEMALRRHLRCPSGTPSFSRSTSQDWARAVLLKLPADCCPIRMSRTYAATPESISPIRSAIIMAGRRRRLIFGI